MMRIPHNSKGHAVVEVALMAPWIFLLFIGTLDFGFYAYSAISVENAARSAVLYTSSSNSMGVASDSAGACYYVLQELKNLPNVGNLTACNATPLQVTAAATTISGQPASQVTVTYRSIQMIPIPWIPGVYNITRVAVVRQTP